MKIDEKQKSQFIVLCCLVALVIGFGAYRLLGAGKTSASSVKPTKKVAVEQKSLSEQAASAQITESSVVGVEISGVSESGRDPFAPQMFPKLNKVATPAVSRRSDPVPLPPVFPRMSLPAVGFRSNANTSVSEIVDPDKAAIKQMTVTGVVNGPVKVAIIRGSAGVRYIVREGQWIDDKYQVENISSRSVWISYKGRNFVLRLGGNDSSEKRIHL